MANGMQGVSFMGNNYAPDLAEIERKKKLAESLQSQSLQSSPTEIVNGWAVRQSPLHGVANLAQALVGKKMGDESLQQQKELGAKYQADMMETLSKSLQARQGNPGSPMPAEEFGGGPAQPAQAPNAQLANALLMQHPATQSLGMQGMAAELPKKPEAFTLKPGEVRYGPDGKQQVTAPQPEEKPAPFTLTPGGKRYDSAGNVIAEAPDKPEPQPRVPPGYRMTKDGNMEAVPGGPADLKLQGAFNQDTAALSGATSSMDRLATAANELMRHPGLGGITGKMSMFPNVPGSDAANAQAKLNTLKSQVGFGVLQDMRNNSRTGGALGSVSDAEGKRLEANLSALENAQSEDQMKESLQKILEYTAGAKVRLQQAFNMKHSPKSDQPASNAPAVGAVQGGYRFKGGNPAEQANWEKVNQ